MNHFQTCFISLLIFLQKTRHTISHAYDHVYKIARESKRVRLHTKPLKITLKKLFQFQIANMHSKNRRSLYQWIDFCDFTIQSDVYILTATTTNLKKNVRSNGCNRSNSDLNSLGHLIHLLKTKKIMLTNPFKLYKST